MDDPKSQYKLIIEGSAPENISEGTFDIEFYSSNSDEP